MLDFVTAHWGSLISIVGLAATIIIALSARSASLSANEAARATRADIVRYLQTIDLQRAIGLIERIKILHDNNRWEASREHYQTLREMLSDVLIRCPESLTDVRNRLATARAIIMEMENDVRKRIDQEISERVRARFTEKLNTIQSDLEELASTMGFGDSGRET